MAELTISAADIEGAIEDYVSSFTADTEREEIGTVIDAGDGIAHVEGLPSVMTQELLEFPGGVLGVALNLDEHSIGAVILGDFEKIEEGQQVKRTGEVLSVPVGDAFLGRVVNPLGQPIDGQGDIETDTRRALELQAPSVVAASGCQRAAADRHQGHRLADPDRPRPAPADHRRPQDRQDRGLRRHDPQPAGELGDRRSQAAGALRVRRDRPEGHHDRQRQARARRGRRDGVHHHRRGACVRSRRLQMACALHGFGHRPALDVRRQARPDRLRRPLQAGRRLPRDLAAAAPPAGPRGVPRRRVLPALPAAGALRASCPTSSAPVR